MKLPGAGCSVLCFLLVFSRVDDRGYPAIVMKWLVARKKLRLVILNVFITARTLHFRRWLAREHVESHGLQTSIAESLARMC